MTNKKGTSNLEKKYNDIPYTSKVFSNSQPTRLHALAKIKGLTPPDLETAKVLEIGCSFGGNLLPFAIKYPKSYIVGVDLAEKQINIGKEIMEYAGIDNIHLIKGDISKISFSNVQFDYIICHGVFSWVPESVQDAILEVIQKYLSKDGVAFVSYNTYPGWHLKDMARELMLFGSDSKLDTVSRINQSMDLLRYTSKVINRRQTPILPEINRIFDEIIDNSQYYIAHEYFEDYNQPFYFKEFIKKIKQHNLAYITDASLPNIKTTFLFNTREYKQVCQYFDNDIESIEQYCDFIGNRVFRESVITNKNNIKNYDINNYELCHSFFNIHIKVNIEKITRDGISYWKTKNDGIIFESNKFIDKIIEQINGNEAVAIEEILHTLKNDPNYDEDIALQILYNCVHSSSTYLNYYPENLRKPSKKPYISDKLRNLIKYVMVNPEIIKLSNQFGENVTFDALSQHIAQYMDGTRFIKDFVEIIKNAIDEQIIVWKSGDKLLTSKDIKNKDIETYVKDIINQLYKNGFFNDY